MTRPLLPALALLAATSCTPVPPPPVCAQREVLQLLSERLSLAGRGQIVQADTVNERPGERPGLVNCAVRTQTATYDIGRFGPAPVIVPGVVNYVVEMRKNAAFLLPEPTGAQPGIYRPGTN